MMSKEEQAALEAQHEAKRLSAFACHHNRERDTCPCSDDDPLRGHWLGVATVRIRDRCASTCPNPGETKARQIFPHGIIAEIAKLRRRVLVMPKIAELGFDCGHFEVVLTANQVVVPGSNGTLKKPLVPSANLDDAAGFYELTIRSTSATVFHARVHVLWVGHPKEPQPFLGFKCDDPQTVMKSLRPYTGQRVSLHFKLSP